MWILFEVVVNLFQAFLMLRFLRNRHHLKSYPLWRDIFCIFLTAIPMCLNSFVIGGITLNVPEIFIFAIPTIYMLFCAKDKWYISLFWGFVLMLLFDLGASLILHTMTSVMQLSYEAMMSRTTSRILMVFVSNSFIALLL